MGRFTASVWKISRRVSGGGVVKGKRHESRSPTGCPSPWWWGGLRPVSGRSAGVLPESLVVRRFRASVTSPAGWPESLVVGRCTASVRKISRRHARVPGFRASATSPL